MALYFTGATKGWHTAQFHSVGVVAASPLSVTWAPLVIGRTGHVLRLNDGSLGPEADVWSKKGQVRFRPKADMDNGSLCFENHVLNRMHVDRRHRERMSWSLGLEPTDDSSRCPHSVDTQSSLEASDVRVL